MFDIKYLDQQLKEVYRTTSIRAPAYYQANDIFIGRINRGDALSEIPYSLG